MRIIGFNGGMGVGKSTAIEEIRGLSGEGVRNVKFAQPLYDIQEMIYERIDSAYQRPGDFVKDRKLLQWIGTEWGRNTISQSLWLDLWEAESKRVHTWEPKTLIVCDDVRFDNEAELIKSMGGKIIKIVSNKSDTRIDTKAGIAGHSSEAGIRLDLVDYMIENNGSLEDFQHNIATVFSMIESDFNN